MEESQEYLRKSAITIPQMILQKRQKSTMIYKKDGNYDNILELFSFVPNRRANNCTNTIKNQGSLLSLNSLKQHDPINQEITTNYHQENNDAFTDLGKDEQQSKNLSGLEEVDKNLQETYHLKIIDNIGMGSFASIFLAEHKKLNLKFVIKKINGNIANTEMSIHRSLDHPFIASFFGSDSKQYLMMEYVKGQSLLEKLNHQKISESVMQKIFCQLLSAIHYIHKKHNIVHRDIKLENILIDKYNNVRLIDFGVSKQTDSQSLLSTYCGSLQYTAPEIIQRKPYDLKVDFWSLGVVLYAMAFGEFPFTSPNANFLVSQIVNLQPNIPNTVSMSCQDLIARLLAKDPESRLTYKEIKNHPWVSLSHDVYYLTKAFTNDPFLKMMSHKTSSDREEVELDVNTLNKLAELGYNISDIKNAVVNDKMNELTFVYRLCHHDLMEGYLNDKRSNLIRHRNSMKSGKGIGHSLSSDTKNVVFRESLNIQARIVRPRNSAKFIRGHMSFGQGDMNQLVNSLRDKSKRNINL